MKREQLNDSITLYEGDCLDVLPTLTGIDAVVTDPPYGIGYKYESGKEATQNSQDYWDFLKPIYEQFYSALPVGGFCAIWNAHKNFKHFWDWFGDNIYIYAACKNFCQILPQPIQLNGYDPVVMFYKKRRKAHISRTAAQEF